MAETFTRKHTEAAVYQTISVTLLVDKLNYKMVTYLCTTVAAEVFVVIKLIELSWFDYIRQSM